MDVRKGQRIIPVIKKCLWLLRFEHHIAQERCVPILLTVGQIVFGQDWDMTG